MQASSSRIRGTSRAVHLGSYPASSIFDYADKRVIPLEAVVFERDGEMIGLDSFDDNRVLQSGSITIYGLWTVDHSQLSTIGRKTLLSKFVSMGYLPTQFNSMPNLSVKVHDSVNLLPYFKKTRETRHALRLSSSDTIFVKCGTNKDSVFEYSLVSLRTEQLLYNSLKYFDQIRVLRLIEIVVQHNKEATPVSRRNPEWLLQQYVRMAEKEGVTPEHSRSQALQLLKDNAEWIARTVQKKRELLNKDAWGTFARFVRRGNGDSPLALGSDCDPVDSGAMELDTEPDTEEANDEPTVMFKTRGIQKEDHARKRSRPNRPTPPPYVWQVPRFHPGRPWRCPDPKCDYFIDFNVGLNQEDFSFLSPEEVEWVQTKRPSLADTRFLELLGVVIEGHYHKHLDDLGIGLFLIKKSKDLYGRDKEERQLITRPREIPLQGELRYEWLRPANHRPAFASLHTDSESE